MNSNCGNSNAIHPQFHGRESDVANPVTHCALDFFERPSVLINYEGSHDQEVFPQIGCRGPQLDFVVTSDNRKLVDFNKFTLDLECAMYDADGKPCREIYPGLFYQQHAPQTFFTCRSFSERETDINQQQCLPPLGL